METNVSPIRVIREHRGLSQDGVARACGISQARLSRLERAQAPLHPEMAMRLASALRCDTTEIMSGTVTVVVREARHRLGKTRAARRDRHGN